MNKPERRQAGNLGNGQNGMAGRGRLLPDIDDQVDRRNFQEQMSDLGVEIIKGDGGRKSDKLNVAWFEPDKKGRGNKMTLVSKEEQMRDDKILKLLEEKKLDGKLPIGVVVDVPKRRMEALISRGLTNTKMAKALGITPAHVSKLRKFYDLQGKPGGAKKPVAVEDEIGKETQFVPAGEVKVNELIPPVSKEPGEVIEAKFSLPLKEDGGVDDGGTVDLKTAKKENDEPKESLEPLNLDLTGTTNSFLKKVDNLRDLHKVQSNDGNWDYDQYMLGMFNGLELALSIFEERQPQYRELPEGRPVAELMEPALKEARDCLEETEAIIAELERDMKDQVVAVEVTEPATVAYCIVAGVAKMLQELGKEKLEVSLTVRRVDGKEKVSKHD